MTSAHWFSRPYVHRGEETSFSLVSAAMTFVLVFQFLKEQLRGRRQQQQQQQQQHNRKPRTGTDDNNTWQFQSVCRQS